MAKPTEIQYGLSTWVGPDGGPYIPIRMGNFDGEKGGVL